MAVALPPTPRSVQFPHNILHESPLNLYSSSRMEHSHRQKPSLPSISALIEAVKDQPPSGTSTSMSTSTRHDRSPNDHQRKHSGASSGHPTSPERSTMMSGSPRSHPPPTPPLRGTSSFDFHSRHSPGNTSPTSTTNSQGGYYSHAPNSATTDNHTQPRYSYPPLPEPGQWSQSQPKSPTEASPREEHRQSTSSSYPEPPTPDSYSGGLAQQRPLPANFPPVPGQQSLPPIDPAMAPAQQGPTPTWQHHHYYPPANPPTYPPPADRYVCPTCQKPFSRPSSLKIHTYSHTGEKPFKCKHDGCGKYFSVRSNMKRHEKGCHGGESSSAGGNSPKT